MRAETATSCTREVREKKGVMLKIRLDWSGEEKKGVVKAGGKKFGLQDRSASQSFV